MEGRLHSSSSTTTSATSATTATSSTSQQQQQFALIIDRSSQRATTSTFRNVQSPATQNLLKQELHDSTSFDSQYGGTYSVERLLQQEVADAKPTISPALLSAVDLVSSSSGQDPLQALHQRQQEQLAVAQQQLSAAAAAIFGGGGVGVGGVGASGLGAVGLYGGVGLGGIGGRTTTALFRSSDSPLVGFSSSSVLNTPPPVGLASPQRRILTSEIGPPLPQLNSLVRNIDRRLLQQQQGETSSTTTSAAVRIFHPQQILQHQLSENPEVIRFGGGQSSAAIISPTSLSASPSSCAGSEQHGIELASSVKEELPHYQGRPVSPLRGRGRPTTNPILDGSPRQHPCPECGKAFPNNSALVKHRLIHSDERNFICSICQKAFKRQDHLNGHLNVHKTVKPFPCIFNNCDKSYCDARSLRRHLEHSHSVQNPVVHSSKGTVYIKCDDLEATVLPNRGGVSGGEGLDEEGDPNYNLIETSSGSATLPGHDYAAGGDQSEYGGVSGVGHSPQDDESDLGGLSHHLVSPTLGLDQNRRPSSKSVECTQCGRTFKNMPALNGHMRLHSSVPGGRGETTPKSFDEMSSSGTSRTEHQHAGGAVFASPGITTGGGGGGHHSSHSSSAPGSTPIGGTSPVDSIGQVQQQRQQQALAQALSSPNVVGSYPPPHMEHEYGIRRSSYSHHQHQRQQPDRPGPGLLMYAPSSATSTTSQQQQQQGMHQQYHVSDAQVQTVHDYASPMSSRPPSSGYNMLDSKQELRGGDHRGMGYVNMLSINTGVSTATSGGGGGMPNESMLSGSDDPTMMSPHLAASLSGLDVSASPDLASLKSGVGGIGNTGGGGIGIPSTTATNMAPMLSAGASMAVDSPYCSSDVDGGATRQEFGFGGQAYGASSGSGSVMHQHQQMGGESNAPGTSASASGSGSHLHHQHMVDGPLDLGPELSKDVDDELIQKELLSFMRFPGPNEFNPFMNDDDEILFTNMPPAKLTERKRHLTAPSALNHHHHHGGYAGLFGTGASSGHHHQMDHYHHHHGGYGQDSSASSSSYYGSRPMLNNYEQNEAVSSMNLLNDESGGSMMMSGGESMGHHHHHHDPFDEQSCGGGLMSGGGGGGQSSSGMQQMMMGGVGDGGHMEFGAHGGSQSMGHPQSVTISQHAIGGGGGGNGAGGGGGGNGKKSRPASRQRRKSRGKPDNVFMLLKSVGLRRSFNLPISPPRFRKHSSAAVESSTTRKFSMDGHHHHHRGGGGNGGKYHHRSGGHVTSSSTTTTARHSRPKPAPLLIPGASLNRFHSQLRSPRLWIGPAALTYTPATSSKSGYTTPTPYTPPPILSPVRHGSGLFWTISRAALAALAGPKSAPISPRFGRGFWPKALPPAPSNTSAESSQGVPAGVAAVAETIGASVSFEPAGPFAAAAVAAASASGESYFGGDAPTSGMIINSNVAMGSRAISPLELGISDESDEQPPATDTTPHINMGFLYQAEIPQFVAGGPRADYGRNEKADLVSAPETYRNLTDEEMDSYCKMASGVTASGGGRNVEYAMHLLRALDGDLEKAYFAFLSPEVGRDILKRLDHLSNYEYTDTCLWTCEEIMKFQEAVVKNDKDFFSISSYVATKSTKQCVQFYYSWKKMCTDEYKRLRAARRRRILPAMALEPNVYDLRSLGPIETIVPSFSNAVGPTQQTQSTIGYDVAAEPRRGGGESTSSSRRHNDERRDEEEESMNETILSASAGDFLAPIDRNGRLGGDRETVGNASPFENEDPTIKTYNEPAYRESPATETGSTSDTIFPCRLCGKVFYKVKSRNAHMKSHSVGSSKKSSPAPATIGSH